MNLHHQLWMGDALVGHHVVYRVRWSDEDRVGTIRRVTVSLIWIGCHCYSHTDLTDMREVN